MIKRGLDLFDTGAARAIHWKLDLFLTLLGVAVACLIAVLCE